MHELLGLRAYRDEMTTALSSADKDKNARCCLLCDYARMESVKGERVVYENESFVGVVPWWAVVRLSIHQLYFIQD